MRSIESLQSRPEFPAGSPNAQSLRRFIAATQSGNPEILFIQGERNRRLATQLTSKRAQIPFLTSAAQPSQAGR
jgi:hypothetical protein